MIDSLGSLDSPALPQHSNDRDCQEFIEAVHCRWELVAAAEMVLAKLPGDVALRLE